MTKRRRRDTPRTTRGETYARRFKCPHCGYTYESPIPLKGMFHPCPARDGDRRHLTRNHEQETA